MKKLIDIKVFEDNGYIYVDCPQLDIHAGGLTFHKANIEFKKCLSQVWKEYEQGYGTILDFKTRLIKKTMKELEKVLK